MRKITRNSRDVGHRCATLLSLMTVRILYNWFSDFCRSLTIINHVGLTTQTALTRTQPHIKPSDSLGFQRYDLQKSLVTKVWVAILGVGIPAKTHLVNFSNEGRTGQW